MTEVAKALASFYGGFGLPAYTENGVPSEEPLPYITYTVPQSAFGTSAVHQVRVWYYGETNEEVNAKADEILDAIGRVGIQLPSGDGYLVIYPGTGALAQNQPSDDTTRIVYINLEIRCYV